MDKEVEYIDIELTLMEQLSMEMVHGYAEALDGDTLFEVLVGLYGELCANDPDISEEQAIVSEFSFAAKVAGMNTDERREGLIRLWESSIIENAIFSIEEEN